MTSTCPDCGHPQFSPVDKKYLELHLTCWCCDEKRVESGDLTLDMFEVREDEAHMEANQ